MANPNPPPPQLDELSEAAAQQRRAVDAIRPLRSSQFQFWVASMRQLADDERELGAVTAVNSAVKNQP